MKTLEKYYAALPDHARHQIQAIEITNVANWFLGPDNPRETYELFHDFPAPVPPYPLTWLEFAMPAIVLHHGQTIDMRKVGYSAEMFRWACLAETHRVDQESRHGEEAFSAIMMTLFHLFSKQAVELITGPARETANAYENYLRNGGSVGWLIVLSLYMDVRRERAVEPLAVIPLFLNEAGDVIDGKLVLAQPVSRRGANMGIEEIVTALYPFMFALSLANAKNVTLKTLSTPDKVAKQRRKKGRASITYKVLEIDGIRREAEQGGVKGSIRRAMHLCRGHFKTYTSDAPLFGKVTGTFWVNAHVRGHREEGLVVKDYVMNRSAA